MERACQDAGLLQGASVPTTLNTPVRISIKIKKTESESIDRILSYDNILSYEAGNKKRDSQLHPIRAGHHRDDFGNLSVERTSARGW